MNNLIFTAQAFKEYQYWQTQDKKTLKRINQLLNDILRNPNDTGIGKAERLKRDLAGFCSRRIDDSNRLIYRVLADGNIEIIHCQGHNED